MKTHPLSPLAEAMQSSVARGFAYFLSWWLGSMLPVFWERALYGGIKGHEFYFEDVSIGVFTLSLLAGPIGWFIMVSHIVFMPVFTRFDIRYYWVLWPLVSGWGWRALLGGGI